MSLKGLPCVMSLPVLPVPVELVVPVPETRLGAGLKVIAIFTSAKKLQQTKVCISSQ